VKKTGLCLMLMYCLTLLNPFHPQLRAKMFVISPQEMIDKSAYIVVGRIKNEVTLKNQNAEYTTIHKEVAISIESALKGNISQSEIVLKRDYRTDIMDTSGVPFEFPKEGTKVMLLLQQDRSGLRLTYANSICEIKEGKLQLYEGMSFRSDEIYFTSNDYEKAYQTFYDKAVVH
jgi:hypothetical protein